MHGRTEIDWSMCISSPKGNIAGGGRESESWSPKSPERKTSFIRLGSKRNLQL